MYRDNEIGVVVPAYNEGGFVTEVLEGIPDFVDRVYAVDDGSTDSTWSEIQAFASTRGVTGRTGTKPELSADGLVVPIRHERNHGAGGAIKTGYLYAREDGVDVTVTIDADGQMDPRAMNRLIDPIVDGRADYAKGNRLARRAVRSEMPTFRWTGNWLLTGLTKVASGYWRLRDPQNGYTAISLAALEAIEVETLYEYYGYSNDVLCRLNAARMRVADVSMPAAYGDEKSSIRYSGYVPKVSTLLFWRFLWRLKERYLAREFHPLVVCYLLGMLGAGYGLARLVQAAADGGLGLAAVGSTATLSMLLSGGLFTALAMAFDRQANRGLEVRLE